MKRQKHPMITGTLILTAAGFTTRVIGFFYKIFLSRTIGAEGLGIYQMIFPIYSVCYALTTAGAEVAISRYVSAGTGHGGGHGNTRDSMRILDIGLCLALSLSVVAAAVLYISADALSVRLLHDERCAELLRIMAFTIPCGACHSCICGYYYGLQRAQIPAAAQLCEQLVRVSSVYLIYHVSLSEGLSFGPSAAVTGMVLGEAASMLLCVFSVSADRARLRPDTAPAFRPHLTTHPASGMLRLAAPVTVNRVCTSLLSSAEATLLPYTLRLSGLSSSQALSIYGTLSGMSMSFIMFPSVLTNSVSVMLLPTVSQSQSSGDSAHLTQTVRKTTALFLCLGSSFTVIFLLTGRFLGQFFFDSELAGSFIITLAWICPFLYLNGALHSILNGLGRSSAGFINNLIGITIRIIFILALVPRIGIRGYLYGLLANQLLATFLNIRSLKGFFT